MRTASRDIVIGGDEIPAGDRVLLLVASANRDPREFEDPEQLDFRRQGLNLTFGYGAHYCLGVHLARLELRVALGQILSRMGNIRLRDDWVPYDSGCSRGPMALNLSFDPRLEGA